MDNIYQFDDALIAFETKYSISKDEKIKKFKENYPRFKDRIKIEGDWLWFIISDEREITVEKHLNNITDAQQITFDFLSSDVTEDCWYIPGSIEDEDIFIYRDLLELFSNQFGSVEFKHSGEYECRMSIIGKDCIDFNFKLKADGLHWEEIEEIEDEYDYDDDDY